MYVARLFSCVYSALTLVTLFTQLTATLPRVLVCQTAQVSVWWLRHHPKVQGLQFKAGTKRQDRVNARVRCENGSGVRGSEHVISREA